MSQSPIAAGTVGYADATGDATVEVEPGAATQRLLGALGDEDCQAILEATTDDALSTNELSERCDLPLSTTYRKLDVLTDDGLLYERTRVRRSGKHTSEYVRRVEDVTVTVSESGEMAVELSRRTEVDGRTGPGFGDRS